MRYRNQFRAAALCRCSPLSDIRFHLIDAHVPAAKLQRLAYQGEMIEHGEPFSKRSLCERHRLLRGNLLPAKPRFFRSRASSTTLAG